MRDRQISPLAKIGSNNRFGYGVIIGDGVTIGDDNIVNDYTVIAGKTEVGSGNYIGDHVSIGRPPTNSNFKYELQEHPDGEKQFGTVRIGDRNAIREFTNIGSPTQELTEIRNDCYIMPHCHVAHDTLMEDGVILSNHCSPGGHTRLLRGANLGKGVQTHQRVVIGQYAMLGIGAVVVRSVLPAVTAVGNPARFLGVNRVGLERNGFSQAEIDAFDQFLRPDGKKFDGHGLHPTIESVLLHFTSMLNEARDTRTIPDMDLSSLPAVSASISGC